MKQTNISQTAYRSEGFIGRYQQLIKKVVIPYQYQVLSDNADNSEGAEKSHVIKNFINAGKALKGEDVGDGFYGMVFQDSDAAKWLEAVAYSLALYPDSELEAAADKLIDIIGEAQDSDGYLNTRFTVSERERRWQNLNEGHELYCSGHMMEAACAYFETTKKDKLLKIMLKNADCIYKRFITEKCGGVPGHPEIELALMKMYRTSGEKKCLELAEYFINERGRDPHFFEKEAAKRSWTVWGNNPSDVDYMQCGKPVREQSEATGHAVRAVYLYTGMAELAAETKDKELFKACGRLWDSITQRQMYITGGIGSTVLGEAFSANYDLPSDTAYAETCAAIGLMFFASAMLKNEIDGKYGDVMERAFYNGVLAGMQLDGKRFFYVNPLEVVPGISGEAPTHRHDLTSRPKWYTCACCPPNVARLVSSFGKYAYGENNDTGYCHMFASGSVKFKNGMEIVCETAYPYGFDIVYKIIKGGRLAVRMPGWSRRLGVTVNGKAADCAPENGYLYFDVIGGDEIKITLDDRPYFVYPSAKIPKLTGSAAVCRGPLVYCFEGVDNEGDVLSLKLNTAVDAEVGEFDDKLLNGVVPIKVSAVRTMETEGLYTLDKPKEKKASAAAVPYYTWGNRGVNQMRVWLPEIGSASFEKPY